MTASWKIGDRCFIKLRTEDKHVYEALVAEISEASLSLVVAPRADYLEAQGEVLQAFTVETAQGERKLIGVSGKPEQVVINVEPDTVIEGLKVPTSLAFRTFYTQISESDSFASATEITARKTTETARSTCYRPSLRHSRGRREDGLEQPK